MSATVDLADMTWPPAGVEALRGPQYVSIQRAPAPGARAQRPLPRGWRPEMTGKIARAWDDAGGYVGPPTPLRPMTPSAYYYITIQVCAREGIGLPEGKIHGDLVTVALNRLTPREWAPLLPAWLDYHQAVLKDGCIEGRGFGSPYHPCLEHLWRAFYLGLPAWVPAALWVPEHADEDAPGALVVLPTRGRLSPAERTRIIRQARACRRGTHGHLVDAHTLAMLGRLSPELQRVALKATPPVPRVPGLWTRSGVLRASRVNWAAAARAQETLRVRPDLRPAYTAGARQVSLLGMYPDAVSAVMVAEALVARLSPEFRAALAPRAQAEPDQVISIASALLRGESPQEIASTWRRKKGAFGCALTRAEAHRWITTAPTTPPLVWLTGSAEAGVVSDPTVAAWCANLVRRGRWALMTRTRRARHGGQDFEFNYLARLDELTADDVAGGATPDEAMRRAAERHAGVDRWRTDERVICEIPVEWPPLPEGMRLLTTPAQLVARGDAEGHCVGGYTSQVQGGRSFILALDVAGRSSTVEITRDRAVAQHYGPRNSTPDRACVTLLDQWRSLPLETRRLAG